MARYKDIDAIIELQLTENQNNVEKGIKKLFFVCPLCGRIEYQKEPYCHCGARMDGDDGDL